MDKSQENTGTARSKKGRPSKQRQEKMKAILWEYYTNGYSANYTALQTGYNWRTVQSYFEEWTEELIDKTNFINRQEQAKARLLIELDRISNLYQEQLDRLKKKIMKKSTAALESLLMQVNMHLARLSLDKAGVIMMPTADIHIANILKERYGIDVTKFHNESEE